MSEWYFDLNTHEVSEGKKHGWEQRMGPYKTREEAEHALDIAHARNQTADDADDWKD